MKKWSFPLLAFCILTLLGGCGKNGSADNTVAEIQTVTAITSADTQTEEASTAVEGHVKEGEETGPSENNVPVTECVPSVMINGILYQDTGYISSAVGCGTMDGEITSTVDRAELPTMDDQSNFGTGYPYQVSSEGQMVVVVDANWKIFRDPKHSFASDMPVEVLNFLAKVEEDRGNGNYLVSVIDVPDIFAFPLEGVYVILTNEKNLKEEITVGDTVRVWFDSLVQEVYPPILPNVYRIVKEEQAAPEPINVKPGIERKDGERFGGVIMIEGMEEAVSYEHIRNSTIGVEMDYDYEMFARYSDSDRERFISLYDDQEKPENYLEVRYSTEDADAVAATISEELSKDYDIIREEFMLERAGSCIRIDASADKGGLTMPERLQMVYIIPADDGCRIATAHYSIEGAEGFGARFRNMMDTFQVIKVEGR